MPESGTRERQSAPSAGADVTILKILSPKKFGEKIWRKNLAKKFGEKIWRKK
jgi:hypothetical protein